MIRNHLHEAAATRQNTQWSEQQFRTKPCLQRLSNWYHEPFKEQQHLESKMQIATDLLPHPALRSQRCAQRSVCKINFVVQDFHALQKDEQHDTLHDLHPTHIMIGG